MLQNVLLIYNKTTMKIERELRDVNLVQGFRDYQAYVQNILKQDGQYMPLRFSDFSLLLVGYYNGDFTQNNGVPFVILDKPIVIDRAYMDNYMRELHNSNSISFGASIYDFEKELEKKKAVSSGVPYMNPDQLANHGVK